MRLIIRCIAVVVLGTCALAGCGNKGSGGPGGPGGRTPEVAFVTITPQRAVLTADLPGRTMPFAVSEVRPQVSGILKERLFIEGSQVQAGQADREHKPPVGESG